ncbi:MAG: hypothetical protein IPI10_13595 [Bacteroidetes bacterium]|nr:hypothetical protein [Bacteroidota bacterium]
MFIHLVQLYADLDGLMAPGAFVEHPDWKTLFMFLDVSDLTFIAGKACDYFTGYAELNS